MIAQSGNGAVIRMFQRPNHFVTLESEPHAAKLVLALGDLGQVFATADDLRVFVEGGKACDSLVVLWDGSSSRCMHLTTALRAGEQFPDWSCGAPWGIKVFPRADHRTDTLVRQIKTDFLRYFDVRLANGMYPWGNPRKGETVRPSAVQIKAPVIDDVLDRMNAGPNLVEAIADLQFAAELPTGSNISWFRVTPEPLTCDEQPRLELIMRSFAQFERACQQLLQGDTDLRQQVLAGVRVDPSLVEQYLHPQVDRFSVRRPDLHIAQGSVFASESDEMPGGMPELWHLDRVYGVNQGAWNMAFDRLLERGPLVFVVSDDWSKCYHAETRWLCEQLRQDGRDVTFLTTAPADIGRLNITQNGVELDGYQVGTIWRQFPIWEATGDVAELVRAAHRGAVRMVPEFAHFGNKVWFSIYHTQHDRFKALLPGDVMGVLDEVLPQSYLVQPSRPSYPIHLNGSSIGGIYDLQMLPEAQRDHLVLKLVGANPKTARSYGVLMGHGMPQEQWSQWVRDRYTQDEPFIVQHRLPTDVVDLAVIDARHRKGELFPCRVLMRPWEICDILVSAHACAVPSNTLRVHGRVDMCATSVNLG